MRTQHRAALIAASMLAFGSIGLMPSRAGAQNTNSQAQRANDSVDRAANNADRATNPGNSGSLSDRAGNAVDRTENAMERAADRVGQTLSGSTTQPTDGGLSAHQVENIQEILAQVTNAALTKGGFDDLVERLSKADRQRLNDFANSKKFDDLDGRIAQLQKDWKAKYNDDFKLSNEQLVFGTGSTYQFIAGAGLNSARMAGAQLGSNENQTPNANTQARTDMDRTATSGNEQMATVIIPPKSQMSEVTLHLVNEGTVMNAWRIDIPDTISGQRLHDSLLKHLTMIDDMKAQWPSDVNEAYRHVATHVLAALCDSGSSSTMTPGTGNSNTP